MEFRFETLYILEIDSSVFKSVQVSSIKNNYRVAMTNMTWQRESAFSVGVIMNTSC